MTRWSVMIAAALILLFWFWWHTPSHHRSSRKQGSGQDVLDEAVTAFDDIARQIVNSGRMGRQTDHDHPACEQPVSESRGTPSSTDGIVRPD